MIQKSKVSALLSHVRNSDNLSIIGNGFLNRGSTVLLVGTSGSGKSKTAQAQCCALSTGMPFVGITPNGAFKVLYIQAEDTVDDLAESLQGYFKHDLGGDPAKRKLLEENLTVVTLVAEDGSDFINRLDQLCEEHEPDVVVVDPLLAYLGCDVVDQKAVTTFLRKQLHPILLKHYCGMIGVHHSRKDKGGPAIDQAIGAMEFAAFFRGIIHLGVKEDRYREVTLKVVKRQRQMGWKDALGKPTDTKLMLKGEEEVFFTEVSGFGAEEAFALGGRTPNFDPEEIAKFIEKARQTETDEKKLVKLVAEKYGYSEKQARRYVRKE